MEFDLKLRFSSQILVYIQLWTIVYSIIFSRKLWKYHSQSKLRFDFNFLNFIQPYLSFNFEFFSNQPSWIVTSCLDFEYFQNFLNFTTMHFALWTLNFFLVFINWNELRNFFEIFFIQGQLDLNFENFWNFFNLKFDCWTLKIFWTELVYMIEHCIHMLNCWTVSDWCHCANTIVLGW